MLAGTGQHFKWLDKAWTCSVHEERWRRRRAMLSRRTVPHKVRIWLCALSFVYFIFHARTEQSYGLLLFISKEWALWNSKLAGQQDAFLWGKKPWSVWSAVISIRMLPLCQMPSTAWYGLFSPLAFQDNNFNVDPELHFAFFKHGGNLWLLLLLN